MSTEQTELWKKLKELEKTNRTNSQEYQELLEKYYELNRNYLPPPNSSNGGKRGRNYRFPKKGNA